MVLEYLQRRELTEFVLLAWVEHAREKKRKQSKIIKKKMINSP